MLAADCTAGSGAGGSAPGSPLHNLDKMTDLVAVWDVALSDGVHKIEFEHGTTSGKRVVYVDGKEEIRRVDVQIGGLRNLLRRRCKDQSHHKHRCCQWFCVEYTLEIDGRSLKKHMENRSKTTNTWVLHLDGEDLRVLG
ncbi:hypothetical protein STEG23_005175 [Scotinomys teguina]